MPTDKKRSNGRTAPKPPISDSQIPVSKINSNNGRDNQIATNQISHDDTEKIKSQAISITHIPKIDVIEGVEANDIARKSNLISIVAVSISALLFIGTLVLVIQSRRQTEAAIKSSNAAISADSLTKIYNDSTLKLQKIVQRKSNIADSLKHILDTAIFNAQKDFYTNSKKGVDAQISSLKETQKEFEIENKPYLQVTHPIDNPITKKDISLSYNLENIGNQPAKIFSRTLMVAITTPQIKSFDILYKKYVSHNGLPTEEKEKIYVIKEADAKPRIIGYKGNVTDSIINAVNTGLDSYYLFGTIKYINTTNDKQYYYRFAVEMNRSTNIYNYIENENGQLSMLPNK